MSKGKHREGKSAENSSEQLEASEVDTKLGEAEPLLEEVQQFLVKRAELASKLSQEIEATEKKLVELKKTVTLLFPETESTVPKDRKLKKTKPKTTSRSAKTEEAESTSDSEG